MTRTVRRLARAARNRRIPSGTVVDLPAGMAVRRLHALAASVALIALAATIQAAPAAASWQPEPERYGVGKHQNVPVTMSDGTVLRADVYFPTDTRTGARDRAVPRDPHPDAVRQGLELDQLSRR